MGHPEAPQTAQSFVPGGAISAKGDLIGKTESSCHVRRKQAPLPIRRDRLRAAEATRHKWKKQSLSPREMRLRSTIVTHG
jgi:hypothetical protein